MANNEDMLRMIRMQQLLKRNLAYANPQWQQQMTKLSPEQEKAFMGWVQANKVPFNPKDLYPDYDMRGFWLAQQNKDPRAINAIDPYDKQIHYPDYWKTPYHETFSSESQWAKEGAPSWKDDVLTTPKGEIIFDPRKKK